MVKNRYFALAIVVFTKVCLAVGNIWAKDTFTQMNPSAFMGFSLLFAILGACLYTFVIKKERIPFKDLTPRVWFYLIQIAIAIYVIGSLSTFSLSFMKATTHSFLQNMVSLITIFFSVLMLGEKPNRWQLLGAFVVLIGVYVFFPARPQGSELWGIVMAMLAVTGMAYFNNLSRKLVLETKGKISNNIIATIPMVIGGTMGMIMYFSLAGWNLSVPNLESWGSILFTGLAVRALGMILWNLVLRTLRSYEASLAGATYVIWATLLGVWMLNETVLPRQWLGIGILILGLILVQIKPQPTATVEDAESSPPALPQAGLPGGTPQA